MNFRLLVVVAMLGGSYLPSRAGPDFHAWQERPAMGWNSWDIFGGDMTKLDAFTKDMLTNPEMLEVNQHSTNNRQISRHGNLIVWAADVPGSADKYLALFNARSRGDHLDFPNADYASPVIAGEGRSQDISVAVKGGKRLVLFVRDGGDGFEHDHAVWVDPSLRGPKGRLNLTELKWTDATAGWGQPRVNRTCEDQPLLVDGKPVEGIGTHPESRIIYDLPEGCETFTAKGVMTRGGSVVFGVLVDRNTGDNSDEAEVGVDLADIGIPGKATVRDLWAKKEIGSFEGRFSRKIRMHGAGLYRVSPPR